MGDTFSEPADLSAEGFHDRILGWLLGGSLSFQGYCDRWNSLASSRGELSGNNNCPATYSEFEQFRDEILGGDIRNIHTLLKRLATKLQGYW